MSDWADLRTIELTRGQITVVDVADFSELSKRSWSAHPRRDGKGFYAVSSNGQRMHRVLLNAAPEQIVDHIDGDGLNNRRTNLRIGTQSQNCVNRKITPGIYLRGVQPKKRKWRACIKHQGKNKSLGYFNTEQEAHAAYVAAAKEIHGDWYPQPLPAPPKES